LLSETRGNTVGGAYVVESKYDQNSNRTWCQYPDTGRVLTTQFDGLNRMSSLTDTTGVGGAATVTDYQYDANGNRTACIQANGVTTANEFDALNRATEVR